MSLWSWYPAAAVVAVIGGSWGWVRLQQRRMGAAVAEAAARLQVEQSGLTLGIAGIPRDGARLLDLASIAAELAAEQDALP